MTPSRALTLCALLLTTLAVASPTAANDNTKPIAFCGQTFPLDTTEVTCNDASVTDLTPLGAVQEQVEQTRRRIEGPMQGERRGHSPAMDPTNDDAFGL